MLCPVHSQHMVKKDTRHGPLFVCPREDEGCEMACWVSSTSTPADKETRALRHQCHEAFDPLWQTRRPFKTRNDAYRWLRQQLGLPVSHAHIGMLNKEQCQKLLAAIAKLTSGAHVRT